MTVNALIKAISAQKVVTFCYAKDAVRAQRTCHPHVLYTSSTGKTCLDCYQVAGPSHGALPGWRPFDVAFITQLRVLEDTFPPAPGYNPYNAQRYPAIVARVH